MADIIATAQQAAFATFEEATLFLEETAKRAGVKHLSYWYLQFSEEMPDQVVWVATYDPEYMSLYMRNFTPMGDPVIGEVMENSIVDWSEWLNADGVSQNILEIASKYGLTKFGISLPLRCNGSDRAIFSICVDSNDVDWAELRGTLAKRFKPFAQDFHVRMAPMIQARQKGDGVYAF